MPLISSSQAPMSDGEFFTFVNEDLDQGSLELPMLPITAMRVFRLASDPGAAIATLVEVIEADQKLASEVIRLANSAAYAGQTTMTSVHFAATRLGLGAIVDVAVAAGFRSAVFDQEDYLDLLFEHWQCSLATALWSRELAKYYDGDKSGAYLCGLLHNIEAPIAIKVVAEWTNQHRRAPVEQALRVAERLQPQIAARLYTEWEVPTAVRLLFGRTPDGEFASDDPKEVIGTGLARCFADHMLDPDGYPLESLLEHHALNSLGLDVTAIEKLLEHKEKVATEAESLACL